MTNSLVCTLNLLISCNYDIHLYFVIYQCILSYMNKLVHERKSNIGGQRTCGQQVRWSNKFVLHKFIDLSGHGQRRCVPQVL